MRNYNRGSNRVNGRKELYELLWAYYENNDLYQRLAEMGIIGEECLKPLRNPAWKAVEFYTSLVWPGSLPTAIPIVGEERIKSAIEQIWAWSNWGSQKQVAVRHAAVTGDVYLKVAQSSSRVFIQVIKPHLVTEKRADERDFITYCRLDSVRNGKGYTEIWDKSAGVVKIWEGHGGVIDERRPTQILPLSTWGIDFIPIVHIRHLHLGGEFGTGAFTLAIDKIDEANRQATRLHKMLFRHNDVTHAISANGVDPTGRPMPALKPTKELLEVGGERFISLPGTATIQQLVPNLPYGDALAIIHAQMAEIASDLPEVRFFSLYDLPEASGRAVRLVMTPALMRAQEVRGNHETGLVRCHEMALTIAKNVLKGGFANVGSYENGDFVHTMADRPILPMDRVEMAEVIKEEVSAGIPLVTSLARSGWSAQEIEGLLAEMEAQRSREQASFATALISAERKAMAGGASNGFEQ